MLSMVMLLLLLLLRFSSSKNSLMGSVKLSTELVEKRGEEEKWDKRCRGSKWPWKKISSAGDRSTSREGGVLDLSWIVVLEEWREIVKENSWEGEEDGEGGFAIATPSSVIFCTSFSLFFWGWWCVSIITVEMVLKTNVYVKFSLYDLFFLVERKRGVVLWSFLICCMDVNKALRGIREPKNMERKRGSLSNQR